MDAFLVGLERRRQDGPGYRAEADALSEEYVSGSEARRAVDVKLVQRDVDPDFSTLLLGGAVRHGRGAQGPRARQDGGRDGLRRRAPVRRRADRPLGTRRPPGGTDGRVPPIVESTDARTGGERVTTDDSTVEEQLATIEYIE